MIGLAAKSQVRRRLLLWAAGAAVSAVGAMMAWVFGVVMWLLVMLAPLLLVLGVVTAAGVVVDKVLNDIGSAVGTVACIVSGTCATPVGPAAPTMDESAVSLVTQYWLSDETRAVTYYCAKSQPCVNVAFVQAVMMQESGGDDAAVSNAGANGLMQVEPYHFTASQSAFDPLTNIMVGVGFLDQLDAEFDGNLPLVAAGYNAGGGAVQDWEEMFGTSDWAALSQEPYVESYSGGQTFEYVSYVMGYYGQFSLLSTAAPATVGAS